MTETPQTTRCRVRINVTGQGQHQCEEPAVEGGYCAKHQSAFSRHLIPPVPAPSDYQGGCVDCGTDHDESISPCPAPSAPAGEPVTQDLSHPFTDADAARLAERLPSAPARAGDCPDPSDCIKRGECAGLCAQARAGEPTLRSLWGSVPDLRERNDDGTMCEDCEVRPPTEFFENAVGLCGPCAIQREVNMLSPEGKAHVLALARARALAPATAEPTAEVREALRDVWMHLAHRDDGGFQCAEHRDGPDTCDCGATEAYKRLTALLSRGSGPVGQASEVSDELVESMMRLAVDNHPQDPCAAIRAGIRAAFALATPAVAASAEAKRIEITDAMVERGTDALWSIGMHERPNRDLAKHAVREILRAAHASPESGV